MTKNANYNTSQEDSVTLEFFRSNYRLTLMILSSSNTQALHPTKNMQVSYQYTSHTLFQNPWCALRFDSKNKWPIKANM